MSGWTSGPGDFRDIPDMLRRLASEAGFGPPRSGGPGHGQGRSRGSGPWGPPPWGGASWGGSWGGPWRGPRHRGPRAGRGDVRSAVLALLSEQPMHGYQIIQEIGRRSGGSWRPSPGSVYPTLQQLEDEGLVRADERDGRRVYRLTDDGQAHVADRAEEFQDLWQGVAPEQDEGEAELGDLVFGVASAFVHVLRTGSARQVGEARKVLARTRSDLYRILGDDQGADNDETDEDREEDQS